MKLDPEAFKRGKDKERRDRQRVAAGREESGNAFLSARELAIEDALASKAHIDALAVMLRRGGLPGTLQRLRVLAFNDLTQGRDPRDRLTSPGPADDAGQDRTTAGGAPGGDSSGSDDDASWDGCPDMPEWQHERRGTREDNDHHDGPGPPRAARAVPRPDQPHHPGRHRLRLVHRPRRSRRLGTDRRRRHPPPAASRLMHPRTRWRVTPWRPTAPPPRTAAPAAPTPGSRRRTEHLTGTVPHPAGRRVHRIPARAEHHLHPDRRRQLRPCDPKTATPPAANSGTWSGPAPRAAPRPAAARTPYHNDLDHTLAYPAGSPPVQPRPACRRHHRVKQAPGWRLDQSEPGVMHLDHALRTQLHHPAHRLRAVTWPTIFGPARLPSLVQSLQVEFGQRRHRAQHRASGQRPGSRTS